MEPNTLIFNFDGTGSEPPDTERFNNAHFKEDASITNILKLHLLFGGHLNEQPVNKFNNQISFYYAGIGTQGSGLKRTLNKTFAPRKDDVASILNQAMIDFKQHYQHGDTLLLTGFSRGAALARRFAKCLEPFIQERVYLCVFDTVASIGLSKLRKTAFGAKHVVFENHTIAANISSALHCVAIDEKRRAFEPTLMNTQNNVTELWFAGAHSDVGGGYYRDGLADICLRHALEWLLEQPLRLSLLTSQNINYDALLSDGYFIGQDDITITPDPFALSHQQDYFWFNPLFKLIDRECVVLINDTPSDTLPLVHCSVAQRIHKLRSYRPESLKNLHYKILYRDNAMLSYQGTSAHIHFINQNMVILEVGKSQDVVVFASEFYNTTGLMLEQGGTYRFTPYAEQTWYDDGIICGPQGWHRDNVQLGIKALPITLLAPFKRLAHANWFALIGAIDDSDEHLFEIASGADINIPKSGEFCPFANDLKRFYGANAGKIKVKVTRLS